jgi:NADPH:quinone reductase-like Zn-dependent oxidoreductase
MIKRIWIETTGASKVLTLKSEEDSEGLSDEEVLIEVHYSGINFADIIMRLGLYKDAPKRPFVPGYEVSGIIKALGKSVQQLQVGDSVVAGTLFGGYSSQVKVPQDLVFKLPAHLSLAEGAALPVNWITAHAALVDMGRVRKGDRVLVDSATGGVGTVALQMLKKLGAHTTGLTSSESKLDYIRSLGATAMTLKEFNARSSPDSFDLILNSQGGSSVRKQYNHLSSTGRVIAFGMSSGIKDAKRDYFAFLKMAATMPRFSLISMFDKNRGVFALNALKLLQDSAYRKGLKDKWIEVETLNIKPHVDQVFSSDRAHEAHEFLESKKAVGKVLLSWR